MEKENRELRESYIKKKFRQKITIVLIAIIIITLIILTFIIPDFWENSIAFIIILGIVFFIPITILVVFFKTRNLLG